MTSTSQNVFREKGEINGRMKSKVEREKEKQSKTRSLVRWSNRRGRTPKKAAHTEKQGNPARKEQGDRKRPLGRPEKSKLKGGKRERGTGGKSGKTKKNNTKRS